MKQHPLEIQLLVQIFYISKASISVHLIQSTNFIQHIHDSPGKNIPSRYFNQISHWSFTDMLQGHHPIEMEIFEITAKLFLLQPQLYVYTRYSFKLPISGIKIKNRKGSRVSSILCRGYAPFVVMLVNIQ